MTDLTQNTTTTSQPAQPELLAVLTRIATALEAQNAKLIEVESAIYALCNRIEDAGRFA